MSVRRTSIDEGRERELRAVLAGNVADDLRILAALHDREPDTEILPVLRDAGFPQQLGLRLKSEDAGKATDLFGKALEALGTAPDRKALDDLAVDYAEIYLNHGYRASPCESVWFDDEGLERQEAMFQVREHYERHGLRVRNWRERPDDHLVHQLEFIALLFSREGADGPVLREAARFMDEHLLRWIDAFADRVSDRCETPFFAGLALLTAAYLTELRDLLAGLLGVPRPGAGEIEERMRSRAKEHAVPAQFIPGSAPGW